MDEVKSLPEEGYSCLRCGGWILRNSFGFWCNQCQKYWKTAKKDDKEVKWKLKK